MPKRGPHHVTTGPELARLECDEDLRDDDFLWVAASATPGRSAAIAQDTTSLFSMIVLSWVERGRKRPAAQSGGGVRRRAFGYAAAPRATCACDHRRAPNDRQTLPWLRTHLPHRHFGTPG